ncbi:MAG: hypothetical protein HQ557_19845 [Bacteroidetes bacterium]|nr:hypothetical protein [Bacteroidota bacterium]
MKHKNFSLFILFVIICSQTLFSQENKEVDFFNNKHEISISGMNIFDNDNEEIYYYPYPWINWYGSSSIYYPYYNYTINKDNRLYGLAYKYHISKHALRLNFYFNNSSDKETRSNNDYPDTPDIIKYNISRYRIGFGYEMNKNFVRTGMFIGIDFYYDFRKEFSKSETAWKDRYYDDPLDNNNYIEVKVNNTTSNTDNKNSYGITQLVGVKYFLTPYLSFSTEARLIIENYSSNEEYWDFNDHPEYGRDQTVVSEHIGSLSKIATVGTFSVNIHF